MAQEYSDCFYCGGAVEEQFVPREIRWQGRLFIIENVPTGVCVQCGHKVLVPEVAKAIDRMLHEQKRPQKTIQVPVYQFDRDVA